MTLDRVEASLSRAFDHGMVYVALSRVKSLAGLKLTGFVPSKVTAHPAVVAFYRKLGCVPPGETPPDWGPQKDVHDVGDAKETTLDVLMKEQQDEVMQECELWDDSVPVPCKIENVNAGQGARNDQDNAKSADKPAASAGNGIWGSGLSKRQQEIEELERWQALDDEGRNFGPLQNLQKGLHYPNLIFQVRKGLFGMMTQVSYRLEDASLNVVTQLSMVMH